MDTDESGYITLEEWIAFAVNHITDKMVRIPKDILGGSSDNVSKQDFLDFIKKAVDRSTPEFNELYCFLLKTFQDGDEEKTGEVGPVAFDKMIEAAAEAPRRFGLAPKSSAMFKTDSVSFPKLSALNCLYFHFLLNPGALGQEERLLLHHGQECQRDHLL